MEEETSADTCLKQVDPFCSHPIGKSTVRVNQLRSDQWIEPAHYGGLHFRPPVSFWVVCMLPDLAAPIIL